jgi:uncharacterized protein YqeY
MKTAMRAQEKERLGTIRLILAALKQLEVGSLEGRVTLSDEQVLSTLNKMIKQRRDSISQYEAGNRPDLAKIEAAEIIVIQQCKDCFILSFLSNSEMYKIYAYIGHRNFM